MAPDHPVRGRRSGCLLCLLVFWAGQIVPPPRPPLLLLLQDRSCCCSRSSPPPPAHAPPPAPPPPPAHPLAAATSWFPVYGPPLTNVAQQMGLPPWVIAGPGNSADADLVPFFQAPWTNCPLDNIPWVQAGFNPRQGRYWWSRRRHLVVCCAGYLGKVLRHFANGEVEEADLSRRRMIAVAQRLGWQPQVVFWARLGAWVRNPS